MFLSLKTTRDQELMIRSRLKNAVPSLYSIIVIFKGEFHFFDIFPGLPEEVKT